MSRSNSAADVLANNFNIKDYDQLQTQLDAAINAIGDQTIKSNAMQLMRALSTSSGSKKLELISIGCILATMQLFTTTTIQLTSGANACEFLNKNASVIYGPIREQLKSLTVYATERNNKVEESWLALIAASAAGTAETARKAAALFTSDLYGRAAEQAKTLQNALDKGDFRAWLQSLFHQNSQQQRITSQDQAPNRSQRTP